MTRDEFEKLIGEEVEPVFYDEIIEPMYSATTLDKNEFALLIDEEQLLRMQKSWTIKELTKRLYIANVEIRKLRTLIPLPEPEGDEET